MRERGQTSKVGGIKVTRVVAKWMSVGLEVEESLLRNSSRHCVVSLSKTLYPLLSTVSTQEDRKSSYMTEKLLTRM